MKSKIKKAVLLLILIFIIWIFYSYSNDGLVYSLVKQDPQDVANYIRSFGFLSVFIFLILTIAEVIFAPIPPLVLYIVSGMLYGGFYGGIIVLIGNLIGAYIAFMASRYFFRKSIEKKIAQKTRDKFNKYFEKYGFISIVLLRLNPVTTSDLISYLAGLTKINSTKFLIATAIGLIPLIFIQTFLGHAIIN